MYVEIADQRWQSGFYNYNIPMSKKLRKALMKLDKAGLIPGGVDGLVELIAQETIGVALARFYDPQCVAANGEHDDD